MQSHVYVAIVTLATVLVYFWMAIQVARTRRQVGIFAPTMTGDPLRERTVRAHYNTLEWLPIVLPALWLFAIYWSSPIAAGLGVVWIVDRIVYFIGYRADASMRRPRFFIQAVVASILALGALGRLLYLAAMSGP